MKRVQLVLFVLLSVVSPALADPAVSLEYLRSLETQESYQELYEKLELLPAQHRDEYWQRLLKKSSTYVLEGIIEQPQTRSLERLRQMLDRYPQLQREKTHGSLLRKGLQKLFYRCVEASSYEECVHTSVLVLQKTPQSNEKDMEAFAQLLAKEDAAVALAVYSHLIEHEGHVFLCEQGAFQHSIVTVLDRMSDGIRVKEAERLLQHSCGTSLLSHIRSELATHSTRFQSRVCPVLLKNNLLSGLQKKRCERAATS